MGVHGERRRRFTARWPRRVSWWRYTDDALLGRRAIAARTDTIALINGSAPLRDGASDDLRREPQLSCGRAGHPPECANDRVRTFDDAKRLVFFDLAADALV